MSALAETTNSTNGTNGAYDELPKELQRPPHPRFPALEPEDVAELGMEWAREYNEVRDEAIRLEREDALRYGHENSVWKEVDQALAEFRKQYPVGVIVCVVFGGTRSSKTEWRAKRTVENMLEKPDYQTWACHSTQESSREAQQKKIYKYIPPEFKPESGRYRHGKSAKVVYTPWGGFTENVLSFPSNAGGTSECHFKFYGMDPRSLRGAEINDGWMDEESSIEWLDELIARATTRNGIVYLTFQAGNGVTALVSSIISGARTVKEVDALLLPVRDDKGNVIPDRYEKVPRLQENLEMMIATGDNGEKKRKVRALIFYFNTSDNVYGNPESQIATLEGASREKILSDFYGVPTKTSETQFPLFRENVHVVSLNLFREIVKNDGTWYQFLDPCSRRNWFMDYVFVDPLGRKFVAAEFPSHTHGDAYVQGIGMPEPWAYPGDAKDGKQGGGQKEWGWGYTQYLEQMARMEALLAGGELKPEWQDRWEPWEKYSELCARYTKMIKVRERWIDARYGNAKRTDEENPTTTILDLSERGMDFLAAPSEKSINSGRGGGDGSLRMINDMFFYDVERAARENGINATNTPRLFVVETCPNVIFAVQTWTGADGQKGATKDPIDVLRMLALTDAGYVDVESLKPVVHSHFQRP